MNTMDVVSLATERNAILNQANHENAWCILNGEKIVFKRAPVIDALNRNQAATFPDVEHALLPIAVKAARIAFSEWTAVPFGRRKVILSRLLEILDDHTDELSRLLSEEQGVTLAEAKWEINLLTKALRPALMQMEMREKDQDVPVKQITKRYVQIDSSGAVRPTNLPLTISFGKVLPALLAGDTIVLRPHPSTLLTVLRISEYIRELLPPGVFNVVPGGYDVGPEMMSHSGIDLVTVTMSATIEKPALPHPAGTDELGAIAGPGTNTLFGSIVVPIFRKPGQYGLASMLFDILSFQPARMKTQVLVWSLARKASYTHPIFRRDS